MRIVDALTRLPVVHQTWGQTHVTALATNLPFRVSFEPGDDGGWSDPRARRGASRRGLDRRRRSTLTTSGDSSRGGEV